MNIMYAILVALIIAAIWVKRDPRHLNRRSNELQKTLNGYLQAERKGHK